MSAIQVKDVYIRLFSHLLLEAFKHLHVLIGAPLSINPDQDKDENKINASL